MKRPGLGCFAAVTDAGCMHLPTVAAGRLPRDLPEFAWVNTVLGNLKTSLAGTHHALNYAKYAKYAGSYLAGFAYRFNRPACRASSSGSARPCCLRPSQPGKT